MRAGLIVRAASATFALLAGAVAGPVEAAQTTAGCAHLITDPRGNAQMWFLPTKPYNPQSDLLYVDATYDRSQVDLTFGLASVQARPTTGTSIIVYFVVGQQGPQSRYDVNASHETDGNSFGVQNDQTQQAVATTGTVDPSAGTVVIHVPLRDIGARYGDVLHGLGVIVSQDVGTSVANSGFIEQSTGPAHHYRIGYVNNCRPR
jgi:hypothetical protein